MWQERLSEFVTLLVVINPMAAVPIFLMVAVGLEAPQQRKIALYAVLVSFGVLLFFIAAGGFLLKYMGVAMRAFQIAGGMVLFIFAVTMVIGDMRPPAAGSAGGNAFARAVYPLAIPKIAGPGAMLTVMVLTDDDRFNVVEQSMTVGVVGIVLVIQLVVLLLAAPISRRIGEGGTNIIGRVMGMLLAAMAVNIVLSTTADWLSLPKL